MTNFTNSQTEIENILNTPEKITKFLLLGNGVFPDKYNPIVYNQAIAAINQLLVKARLDELESSTVPDDFYWNSDQSTMTIAERKHQLQSQLSQEDK